MQHPTPDELVCDLLFIDTTALGFMLVEDPEDVRSWFDSPEPFKGNYFELDNSPAHKANAKRKQLIELAVLIRILANQLGSEEAVVVYLHRKRRKLGGKSFVDIAHNSRNPLPEDNGIQELITRIRSWCGRKDIPIPQLLIP